MLVVWKRAARSPSSKAFYSAASYFEEKNSAIRTPRPEPELNRATGPAELIQHSGPSGPKQPYQVLEYFGKNRALNSVKHLEGEEFQEKASQFLQQGAQQAFRAHFPLDRNTIFKTSKYISTRGLKMISYNAIQENPVWMKRAFGYKAVSHYLMLPFFKQMLERFLDNVGEVGSAETQIAVCAIRTEQILSELDEAKQAYERVKFLNLTDPQMKKAFNFMSKCVWDEDLVKPGEMVDESEYIQRYQRRRSIIKAGKPVGRDGAVIKDLQKLCKVYLHLKDLGVLTIKQKKLLEHLDQVHPLRYKKVCRLLKELVYDKRTIDFKTILNTFHDLPDKKLDYRIPLFDIHSPTATRLKVAASVPASIYPQIITEEPYYHENNPAFYEYDSAEEEEQEHRQQEDVF